MPVPPSLDVQRAPATTLLAAVAAALELACFVSDLGGGSTLRLDLYNETFGILPRLWAGELWRPFTTTLMHANLLHAGFNIYWLLVFGPVLEERFGSWPMAGVIVLLGYVSMMSEYVVSSYGLVEPVMIVGLSGIIYGLFGLLWLGRRWNRDFYAACDEQTAQILLMWFFLSLGLTYAGIINIANIAHGAGFAFGVLYAAAIWSPRRWRLWRTAAVVLSAVVLSTLIVCPGHYGYEHVRRGGRLWWKPAARVATGAPTVSFLFSTAGSIRGRLSREPLTGLDGSADRPVFRPSSRQRRPRVDRISCLRQAYNSTLRCRAK